MNKTQFVRDIELCGKTIHIESGKMAKQAGGAVTVQWGDTIVLTTATSSKTPKEDVDFFPLIVDYEEKMYAAGKIPGGFIKREGRPSEKAILTARLVDRSIRPLFADNYYNDTQIVLIALSTDKENSIDIIGILGASIALCISDIPFFRPIGAVRIGYIDNEFIINPLNSQISNSKLDLTIAGTEDEIVMLEASASFIDEEIFYEAIELAQEPIRKSIDFQYSLMKELGKSDKSFSVEEVDSKFVVEIENLIYQDMEKAIYQPLKSEREIALNQILENLKKEYEEKLKIRDIKKIFDEIEKKIVRSKILEENKRPDGRKADELREISCEVNLLPRVHGSAIFTRGQTQALSITTLGAISEEQIVDGIEEEENKRFMHQYNFPPFSTGEVSAMRGPKRREIGHGALAEKALQPIIPDEISFPYCIRVVTEILESNGSSSMASVCSSSMALMDAGVPVKEQVAGISIGLVTDDKKYVLLSDIQGIEDKNGDMDFKVAGSENGITAVQLDVKSSGLKLKILESALALAKEKRKVILGIMNETISAPRENLSVYAPRVFFIQIPPDKIGDVIGTGGKTIRRITEETGVKVDIEEDGKIYLKSENEESGLKALRMIEAITNKIEVGKVYLGVVKRITSFGAFIEILPGKEGLLHISQISYNRIPKVEDVLKVGQQVNVRVLNIDDQDRISFTMKGVSK